VTDPIHVGDGLTVYGGDCRAILAELPAESVHCVVTSPPYWGLRDYGTGTWAGGDDPSCDHALPRRRTYTPADVMEAVVSPVRPGDPGNLRCGTCGATRVDAQLGLEATPQAYVDDLVAIFREVRRVLRPEGTVWLNLGDTYNGTGRGAATNGKANRGSAAGQPGTWAMEDGLKRKDLVGIPWRVAFALQADGWYLLSDIVWAKPNPMPESITDRPTKAHEYVFLLAKSERYYYDAWAVREADAGTDHPRRVLEVRSLEPSGGLREANGGLYTTEGRNGQGRNLRSVWTIPAKPYPGAHFATYPPRLVEPCVKAGTSERGCCPDCGAPWTRILERGESSWPDRRRDGNPARYGLAGAAAGRRPLSDPDDRQYGGLGRPADVRTLGWQPSCSHGREPGEWDVIRTPVGPGGSDHSETLRTGRKGLGRRRTEGEGTRPIYRWQQRAYARQLRASEHRDEMAAEAGPAFDHYTRVDRSGARAIPPDLLELWRGRGWLREPEEPVRPPEDLTPAVVLDPFAGSGTTGLVARDLGRASRTTAGRRG
jgi:DNA modification methylase